MTDEEERMEVLLDHYRSPHNYGRIENPTAELMEYNPVCGDTVQIFLMVENRKIREIKFMGRGCSVSQGSASMLTDLVGGKTVDEAMSITPEQIIDMIGLPLGPSREKCALLPLNALQKCLKKAGFGKV